MTIDRTLYLNDCKRMDALQKKSMKILNNPSLEYRGNHALYVALKKKKEKIEELLKQFDEEFIRMKGRQKEISALYKGMKEPN